MRILITGGTGFIGQELQTYLHALGHQTRVLSRQGGWDIDKRFLAADALDDIDAIVHLAGAGIADKRWSEARKKELIHSRVASTRLLAEALKREIIRCTPLCLLRQLVIMARILGMYFVRRILRRAPTF